jgi:hypothetical protein
MKIIMSSLSAEARTFRQKFWSTKVKQKKNPTRERERECVCVCVCVSTFRALSGNRVGRTRMDQKLSKESSRQTPEISLGMTEVESIFEKCSQNPRLLWQF